MGATAGLGQRHRYLCGSLPIRADGVLSETGHYSIPKAEQLPVPIGDIRDGTSNTLFFGERRRWTSCSMLGPLRSASSESVIMAGGTRLVGWPSWM